MCVPQVLMWPDQLGEVSTALQKQQYLKLTPNLLGPHFQCPQKLCRQNAFVLPLAASPHLHAST